MDLSAYDQRLAAAVSSNDKSAFDDLCFDLEYEQLTQERWPLDVFEFFAAALRDPVICGLSGSRSFVLSLYNDFEKLTTEQRASLLALFDAEADNFNSEMLRHSASDLIARKYHPKMALELFTRWSGSNATNRIHMAIVGLEVLIMANKLKGDEATIARSLLAKLTSS